MVLLLTVLVILTVVVIYSMKIKQKYWKRQNVKYIEPYPIIGNYGPYFFQRQTLGKVVSDLCDVFPDESIIGTFYGTNPALIINDPDILKLVMLKDYYYFSGRDVSEHVHKEFATKNLFFTYGDAWRVLRQNLTPIFTSSKLKKMFFSIQGCTTTFEKLIDDEVSKCVTIDVRDLVSRFAIDAMVSSLFGLDSKVMTTEVRSNPYKKLSYLLMDHSAKTALKVVLRSLYPTVFYGAGFSLFPRSTFVFFKNAIDNVVKQQDNELLSRHDALTFLIDMKKKEHVKGDSIDSMLSIDSKTASLEVDDELVAAQCTIFFNAGHQPTSSTVTMTLFELAKHPEIQEKVLLEVDAYLEGRNSIDYDCNTKLPFLHQCVDETLRLYPANSAQRREVYKDYCLPSGVKLTKGMRIYIPVYNIQRNSKYFKEPNEFRPERFSKGEKEKIMPFTYMPFGDGHRLCIGTRFAKMLMIIGLIVILKKYRVKLSDGMPSEVEGLATARIFVSSVPVKLDFIKRNLRTN